MFKSKASNEAGNAVVIVLVVLVAVAIGILAYMSTQSADSNATEPAAGTPEAAQQAAAAGADGEEMVIEPGNPVVAKVNGQDVTRLDIFNYIQTLPPQTRQLPVAQLFPIAVEQVVNARIVNAKTENVNLDSDPEVQKQLALAKENIERGVYIQNQVTARLTEERLKAGYEQYKANFPKIDELKARHILVKEEDKAKDLIKQIEAGGNFEELAKANSIDGTAQNGGDLGYFAKTDVVPEFADAAYALNAGEVTKKPVKTEFGFHVIKVEDKRVRPVAEYDAAKPFLEAQLRRVILDEMIQEWRDGTKIERFDINGKPIEPAAGGEAPAAAPAPAEAPAAAPPAEAAPAEAPAAP